MNLDGSESGNITLLLLDHSTAWYSIVQHGTAWYSVYRLIGFLVFVIIF